MQGFPFLPSTVVVPATDESLAPFAQQTDAAPSPDVSWVQLPAGWKHLNALRVQLFLNTHFAPAAGCPRATTRSRTRGEMSRAFAENMTPRDTRLTRPRQ